MEGKQTTGMTKEAAERWLLGLIGDGKKSISQLFYAISNDITNNGGKFHAAQYLQLINFLSFAAGRKFKNVKMSDVIEAVGKGFSQSKDGGFFKVTHLPIIFPPLFPPLFPPSEVSIDAKDCVAKKAAKFPQKPDEKKDEDGETQ